jgi:hypothetical protein
VFIDWLTQNKSWVEIESEEVEHDNDWQRENNMRLVKSITSIPLCRFPTVLNRFSRHYRACSLLQLRSQTVVPTACNRLEQYRCSASSRCVIIQIAYENRQIFRNRILKRGWRKRWHALRICSKSGIIFAPTFRSPLLFPSSVWNVNNTANIFVVRWSRNRLRISIEPPWKPEMIYPMSTEFCLVVLSFGVVLILVTVFLKFKKE